MFNTIESFSVVFFILSAILVLMVLFEKQCLALEDKFDAWMLRRKRAKRHSNVTRNVNTGKNKTVKIQRNPNPYNRGPRNFAA